jgi:hypothetical protein
LEINDQQYYSLMREAASHGMSVQQYNAAKAAELQRQKDEQQSAIDQAVARALEQYKSQQSLQTEFDEFQKWREMRKLSGK